jgi:hypothetical protein
MPVGKFFEKPLDHARRLNRQTPFPLARGELETLSGSSKYLIGTDTVIADQRRASMTRRAHRTDGAPPTGRPQPAMRAADPVGGAPAMQTPAVIEAVRRMAQVVQQVGQEPSEDVMPSSWEETLIALTFPLLSQLPGWPAGRRVVRCRDDESLAPSAKDATFKMQAWPGHYRVWRALTSHAQTIAIPPGEDDSIGFARAIRVTLQQDGVGAADWEHLLRTLKAQPDMTPSPRCAEALLLEGLYRFMQTHPAETQAAWNAVTAASAVPAPVDMGWTIPAAWLSSDEDFFIPLSPAATAETWPTPTNTASQPLAVETTSSRGSPLSGTRWDPTPENRSGSAWRSDPAITPGAAVQALRQPDTRPLSEIDVIPSALVDSALWPAHLMLEIHSSDSMPLRYSKAAIGPRATPTVRQAVAIFRHPVSMQYRGMHSGLLIPVPSDGFFEAVLVSLSPAQHDEIRRIAPDPSGDLLDQLQSGVASVLVDHPAFADFRAEDIPTDGLAAEPLAKRPKLVDTRSGPSASDKNSAATRIPHLFS